VARFGIFARLDETGADGIIPMNTLPDDYYFHDEKRQALVGKRTKRVFQLAQPVVVKLEQADGLTGSMQFSIVEAGQEEGGKKTLSKQESRERSHRHKRRR
jgi:ribonuclease R